MRFCYFCYNIPNNLFQFFKGRIFPIPIKQVTSKDFINFLFYVYGSHNICFLYTCYQ